MRASSPRAQIFVKVSRAEHFCHRYFQRSRSTEVYLPFSRDTNYCLNIFKNAARAIVTKRFKLVCVSGRDALITSCKRDDVLCIRVRLYRLELRCKQKCLHLNPTDHHKVCNYTLDRYCKRMLMRPSSIGVNTVSSADASQPTEPFFVAGVCSVYTSHFRRAFSFRLQRDCF